MKRSPPSPLAASRIQPVADHDGRECDFLTASSPSRFLDRLELVARAVSLGGAESVASLPVQTSHVGFSAAELRRAGVGPGQVRISIGLEDRGDLWRDLDRALGHG